MLFPCFSVWLNCLCVVCSSAFPMRSGPVPSSYASLASLQSLRLAHNSLTGDPSVIGSCPHLAVVDLNYNQFHAVPSSPSSSSSSAYYDVALLFSKIITPSLQVLHMSHNHLGASASWKDDAETEIGVRAFASESSLISLDLSANGLSTLCVCFVSSAAAVASNGFPCSLSSSACSSFPQRLLRSHGLLVFCFGHGHDCSILISQRMVLHPEIAESGHPSHRPRLISLPLLSSLLVAVLFRSTLPKLYRGIVHSRPHSL